MIKVPAHNRHFLFFRGLMEKEKCFQLGTIVKTHGIKGEVICLLDVDDPVRYSSLKSVFVEKNGALSECAISNISLSGNQARILFEGVNSIDEASYFLKHDVFLPLSLLPPLSGKRFYFHEVMGFRVFDKENEIGIFEKVIELPQHPVAIIKNGDKEILAPLVKEFIVRVERSEKKLFLDLPEGLTDIYY